MDTGRTPDEGALLRVVEHLADVPDGADESDAADLADASAEDDASDDHAGDTGAHEVGPVAAALSDTRHSIDRLNPAEHLFLAQQRSLIAELCDDPTDPATVGALFDRVREQWAQSEDRPELRPLAEVFGVALGDLVRARVPHLDWATSSDRFGTEIVLAQAEPEVLVYPVAAVAQEWPHAGTGWFVRHLETVVHGVSPHLTATDGRAGGRP